MNARVNALHGKLHPDHAGGSHQHGIFRDSQQSGCSPRLFPTIVHTLFSCTGIGNPRVYNNRLGIGTVFHDILIPQNRRRLYHIGRKGSRRPAGRLAVDQRHIHPVLILDICRGSRRPESFRCRYAAFDLFHLFILHSIATCGNLFRLFASVPLILEVIFSRLRVRNPFRALPFRDSFSFSIPVLHVKFIPGSY